MIQHTYLAAARQQLAYLEQTQIPKIDAAAELVAQSLRQGGAIYCSEIGHGIQWDFINRAGGLLAVQEFRLHVSVNCPEPKVRASQPDAPGLDVELENIRHAVKVSRLRAGDVLIVASVSGKNRGPIELALAAQAKGVKVIGFTALAYTAMVKSLHPSGKRLAEVVDIALDNGAPYGDAGLDVPGYDIKLVPQSGLGMVALGWMLWAGVMEKMAAAGTPASVFLSHNRDGGPEFNEKAKEQYHKKGY